MKVRLTTDVPVAKKHGLIKGRIFPVSRIEKGRRSQGLSPQRGENNDRVWIEGDAGKEVQVFRREFEVVGDKEMS